MIELIIFASLIIAIIILYLYFNIKTKELHIQLADVHEAKTIFQKMLEDSRSELSALQNETQTNQIIYNNFIEEHNDLKAQNLSLTTSYTALESTLNTKVKEEVEKARADSIKRQRSILKGQAMEQLAPFIHPDYQVKDYKFMGDPIDYVIFSGMSEKSDDIQIIFMDIKTGTARLTKIQKQIKKAIEEGNFQFQVFRPDSYLEENDCE